MAVLRFYRAIEQQARQYEADAVVLERYEVKDKAALARSLAKRQRAILKENSPSWVSVSDLVEDIGWCSRTLTDFAKELSAGNTSGPIRAKKDRGQWWIRMDIAIQIPEKGEASFPLASAFNGKTSRTTKTNPAAHQARATCGSDAEVTRGSESPPIASDETADEFAARMAKRGAA